jgi:hypothetical protein
MGAKALLLSPWVFETWLAKQHGSHVTSSQSRIHTWCSTPMDGAPNPALHAKWCDHRGVSTPGSQLSPDNVQDLPYQILSYYPSNNVFTSKNEKTQGLWREVSLRGFGFVTSLFPPGWPPWTLDPRHWAPWCVVSQRIDTMAQLHAFSSVCPIKCSVMFVEWVMRGRGNIKKFPELSRYLC